MVLLRLSAINVEKVLLDECFHFAPPALHLDPAGGLPDTFPDFHIGLFVTGDWDEPSCRCRGRLPALLVFPLLFECGAVTRPGKPSGEGHSPLRGEGDRIVLAIRRGHESRREGRPLRLRLHILPAPLPAGLSSIE